MTIQRHAAPLRQEVVRLLRQDILDAVLVPGERLLENALCERYDVSRTVVREALRQLESEHLITMLPNRGPIVTILSVGDIDSIYEVRRSLEGLAGELFALRASDGDVDRLVGHTEEMDQTYLHGDLHSRGASKSQWYRLLLDGTGNEVLAATLGQVHSRIAIFRHYAFIDEARVAHSMHEVRAIVDAAAVRRDPVAAREACEEHIRTAGRLAILEYQKRLDASA